MKRYLIAFGFCAAAILVTASTWPLILSHLDQGGSRWWTITLLIPVIIAVTGVAIAAGQDRPTKTLPTPTWRTYAEMTAAEQTLAARHGGTNIAFWHNAHALWDQPWPRNLAGVPAVLTGAQRELAAEDAAWKRAQDGIGDV